MEAIRVFDIVKKRALITRESAQLIRQAIKQAMVGGGGDELVLDLSGVEAVTPSFVDELLGGVEGVLRAEGRNGFRIVVLHPPTRLSSKFSAIGRARRLEIHEAPDGAWMIEPTHMDG